jgi:uncharacterized membrane protein
MRSGIELVRIETIHPALVHFVIGALPIILLAYSLARWQRSERWSFVGDVAVTLTAAFAVIATVFGLISNAVVPWPGGLESWRAIHLIGGICSALVMVALAVGRVRARRRRPVSGNGALAGAVIAGAVVSITGWIGGDVLVFHSGMAVKAAANGATSPATSTRHQVPRDLLDAMRQVRGSWAVANTMISAMIVEEPKDHDYDVIVDHSRRLEELGRWIATTASARTPGEAGDDPKRRRSTLAELANALTARAASLEATGREHDLVSAAKALGDLEAACARCHDTQR